MSVNALELDELWEAALADAGIAAVDAVLFALPGLESNYGYRAKAWMRGVTINDPDDTEALGSRLEEANSEPIRQLRRVAAWMDSRSLEGLGAILRHEFEHSIQLDAFGKGLQ